MKYLLPCCCLALSISFESQANDSIYGVVSAGYGDTSSANHSSSTGGYKLAVGYQFHRQWYAEFGYHKLADETLFEVSDVVPASADDIHFGVEADALFASILGKASSRVGELYYRLGVLNVDLKSQSLAADSTCADGNEVNVVTGDGTVQICNSDDSVLAGMVGLGFDYYLGVNWMLRLEVEHMSGEDSFKNNAGYIGLRFNF